MLQHGFVSFGNPEGVPEDEVIARRDLRRMDISARSGCCVDFPFSGSCLGGSMMDVRQLRTLFKDFNVEYWGGRLPAYAIHVVAEVTSRGEWGRCLKKRRLIEILRGLPDEDAASTLLHEMAHAAVRHFGHGKPWKREMIRLRSAGAPLTYTDLNIRLDSRSGEPITRRQFRASVQDVLIDASAITLSGAIRHFIQTEGGPPTIAGFLRKYLWARTVFNDEKRENAEKQKRRIEFEAKYCM